MQIVVPWVFGPVRVGAIGEFHRNQRGLHFFFAEQSVVRDGRIPLREIFQIGIDAAITERRGSCALIGFFQRVVFFCVAERAIRNFVFSFFVDDGVSHFQRGKNSFLQKFAVRFS